MSKDEKTANLSELDQSSAIVGDFMPSLWRRLYTNAIDAGFTEQESFKLIQTYIFSQGTWIVNPLQE